jgi:hypothetical protein
MTKICDGAGEPRRGRFAWLAIALACTAACDGPGPAAQAAVGLDSANVVQWKLPKRLKEISGLALSSDERLFAHDDEQAVIYQIDWQRGGLVKAFALGDPPLRDDFEGIAIAGDDFYLITSNGILYRTKEGADGAHVEYERIDTGIGAQCEVEGLTTDLRRNLLLVACKTPRVAALKGKFRCICVVARPAGARPDRLVRSAGRGYHRSTRAEALQSVEHRTLARRHAFVAARGAAARTGPGGPRRSGRYGAALAR